MAQLVAAGEPKLAFACIDGTIARGHQKAPVHGQARFRAKARIESATHSRCSQQGEALGRWRGGLGTKIVGVCDAAGRPVNYSIGTWSGT